MSDPTDQSHAPGAELLEQAVEAYGRVWRKHLDTVNEVWKEITAEDAKFSTWTSGYSKIMHTWRDNTRDMFAVLSGKHRAGNPDCPVLTFVLDKNTQASKEQTIRLPHGVDPKQIACTPLWPLSGSQPLPTSAQVTATPDAGQLALDITIAGLGSADKQGNYSAVVYEKLAANASPPRKSLALVIVTFLAT
jgi:hypothetical protein